MSSSSTSEQEHIRSIAERIARRLSESGPARTQDSGGGASSDSTVDGGTGELAALRARLAEIQQRLSQLETDVRHDAPASSSRGETARAAEQQQRGTAFNHQSSGVHATSDATPTRSPWLSGTYVPATAHPSQERFGISEAVSELVDYFEREKVCSVEPGDKPCDQCGMCSARGF